MTPTKRKLLSILAAPNTHTRTTLYDENSYSIAIALSDLEGAGLITIECKDGDRYYSITPAGRAALIPERSV